jgi:glycosyltransferase involved in cell wall biosynthesis
MPLAEQALVANAGTIYVFQTAAHLRRHGLLKRCATSMYFSERTFDALPESLRGPLRRLTLNRRCAELEGAVKTLMWPEIVHLLAKRVWSHSEGRVIEWRNRRFCSWVAERHLDDVGLVWANDTSSYEIFVAARQRAIPCVLDMSIAHPALGHQIMADYAAKRPDLLSCLDLSAPAASMDRRRAEIDLADHVVVGSSFVRDSLLNVGVAREKITVNPYGVDVEQFRPMRGDARNGSTAAVRFLFVGWFSARKGIYDLIEAWKLSGLFNGGSELVLAGGTREDLTCWRGELPAGLVFKGRVGFSDVPALYRDADVFVFPSLFEGSARVILEAAASGLPVITTPAACDEHWVVDGENGYRVAPADPSTLAARMRELAGDPDQRRRMSTRGRAIAGGYTWTAYGDRCAQVCREVTKRRLC